MVKLTVCRVVTLLVCRVATLLVCRVVTLLVYRVVTLLVSHVITMLVHPAVILLVRPVVNLLVRPVVILLVCSVETPQWGAADAEIKVPSGNNTELKRSPFKAWSRSVYSHIYYAYCQGFLPCLFLPFRSIHLHFFQNLSQFFPVLACRIK